MNNLYKVRYVNGLGETRLGHVKARSRNEASAKARRFVIKGGTVTSVENTFA